MVYKYDFLVIGSGIAGMSYALKVAKYGKVAIIAKNKLEDANTFYAQGGIASVTNPWDNFEKHIDDTLDAGGGLCDPEVVKKVNLFFHDNSFKIIDDDVLALLISMPNVIVTSHQAFLTNEALGNIAETTIKNLDEYFSGEFMNNELCYHCQQASNPEACYRSKTKRCF